MEVVTIAGGGPWGLSIFIQSHSRQGELLQYQQRAELYRYFAGQHKDESLIKQVLRAYIFCGRAATTGRTGRFQFAAASCRVQYNMSDCRILKSEHYDKHSKGLAELLGSERE